MLSLDEHAYCYMNKLSNFAIFDDINETKAMKKRKVESLNT